VHPLTNRIAQEFMIVIHTFTDFGFLPLPPLQLNWLGVPPDDTSPTISQRHSTTASLAARFWACDPYERYNQRQPA
jgi:hypothetical protein